MFSEIYEFIGWLVICMRYIFNSNLVLFQTKKNSKKKHLRYSLFWDVMQRGLVVSYQHFGTTGRSTLQGSSSPYPRKTLVLRKVVGRNAGKRSCWRRPWDIL